MDEYPIVRKPYGSKLISIRINEDMTDRHISVGRAELLCERLRIVLEAQRLQKSYGEILAFSGTVDEKADVEINEIDDADHFGQVHDRISWLSKILNESMGEIENNFANEIDRIDKRIDSLVGDIHDVGGRIGALERQGSDVHARMEAIHKRINRVNYCFDVNNHSAEEQMKSIDQLGARISALEACDDAVTVRLDEHGDLCDASRCEECNNSTMQHYGYKAGNVFDKFIWNRDRHEAIPFGREHRAADADADAGRQCIIYKHEYDDDECDSYIGVRSCNVIPWYSRIEDARKFRDMPEAEAYARELGIVDDVSFRFVKHEGDGVDSEEIGVDGEEIGVGDLVSRGGSDRWVVLAVPGKLIGQDRHTVLCVVEDTENKWDVGDRFDSCDSFKLIAKADQWGS